MGFLVVLFYRYVPLENLEALRTKIVVECIQLHLLGRILFGEEGINGAVCGEERNVVLFKDFLSQLFPNLGYREQAVDAQVYHKLVVRVRKEIVAFGKSVDVTKSARRISPTELKNWYDTQRDFVIIDARNIHEAAVGKFKNALVLPLKTFKDFPRVIERLEDLREKDVVVYCTGGIRCEKASAYMKEHGFSSVYQLEGGIINYLSQYPLSYYEGACFVFDDRLVSCTRDPISSCALCGKPCADYTNCYNLDCDALFVCCLSCREKGHTTCSEACMRAPRQRTVKKEKEMLPLVGTVENYYPKAGVALVRVDKELKKDSVVTFFGNTTRDVEQSVVELRDYDGKVLEVAQKGMLVTFPVREKIRAHDKMYLREK